MSDNGKNGAVKISETPLDQKELALIEVYQRQDALSTQLWQQFLLANAAVVGVVVLVAIVFRDIQTPVGLRLSWILNVPVLGVWAIFTYGGLSAILNAQKILLAIGHQIEFELASKTDLFAGVTRSEHGVKWFHLGVDTCIFILCLLLTASITTK